MSVNINMNVSAQHFTPNTALTPPNSLLDKIVNKNTGKAYRLNAMNRRKFRANPKLYIQPSNKFFDKFSGRFKLRNDKNVSSYEGKLDNEIHLYTVKYNKYQVNKKYDDYIIPSGHTTKNVSVYSKRKEVAQNILAKQQSLNNEADENDPYATQYAIDEVYESEIIPTMNNQGANNGLDFIDDTDDDEDYGFDDDAYDMYGNDITYDNKWFDYEFEKGDDRCVWNYLKYYHNISNQYITDITGKDWKDSEGLTVNDIFKVAKHRGTPLIVLDLCYNIMKDNNGKLMRWKPKEEDRRHAKYFVFIKANHHLYPFTTKTQRAIINKKLSINKSFMERNERGNVVDKNTETITQLEEKAREEGEEAIKIFEARCKVSHTIINRETVDAKSLLETKKNINLYVADATDLNDLYIQLYNDTGICYKYTSNDGLITSITSYTQDKDVIDGLKINTEYGEATGHKFSIFCNTNATITKEICKKYDLFYHNDSLSGVGKRIYNLDKKFKHLCSDYLENPFSIQKPINMNGFYKDGGSYKGYDINKCYSSLLENPLFDDGWEKFEVFDNIEKYDGDKKKNGWFYVAIDEYDENNFLLYDGNGWYSYSMLLECDKRGFKYSITHQYYPHFKNVYKKEHFKDFVNTAYDKCGGDAKHIINSFVGQLGKHKQKKRCCKSVIVNSLDDVAYYTKTYNNLEITQLGDTLYMLNFYKLEDNRSNGLPIHNKIIEMGRVKIQELYESLGGKRYEILLIKTDMIVYNNGNDIKLGSGRGEIKLENLNYDKDAEPIYEINDDVVNNFRSSGYDNDPIDGCEFDEECATFNCDELDDDSDIQSITFDQSKYITDYMIYKKNVFNWWCDENKKPDWIRLQGDTGLSFMRFMDTDEATSPFYDEKPFSNDDKYKNVVKKNPDPTNYDKIKMDLDLLSKQYSHHYNDERFSGKYIKEEWEWKRLSNEEVKKAEITDKTDISTYFKTDEKRDHTSMDVLINEGGFLTGYAGSGKSYQTVLLYKMLEELGKKPLLTATTNKAKANDQFIKAGISTKTIHSVLGHLNPKTFDKEYRWVNQITHLIIDECSMIDKGIYYHLRNIKVLYPHLRIILIGDYQQLPAVDFGAVYHNLETTHFLRWLCSANYLRLTKCMRTLKDGKPDYKMWNICKSILDDTLNNKDLKSNMNSSNHKSTLINLCWTNKKKDILNANSVMNYYKKKVKGDKNKTILKTTTPFCKNKEDNKNVCKGANRFFWCSGKDYKGTYVVATKNKPAYYNNQTFNLEKIDGDNVVLRDTVLTDIYITIGKEEFIKHFDYGYTMTAHRSQGSTIRCSYTIHEWEKVKFCESFRNWRYVVLSRTSDLSKVFIKPY